MPASAENEPEKIYRTVRTVRSTHRGSDYYGNCELCGKECSEHFVATKRRVWVRDNGQYYLDHGSGGTYGHLNCLTKQFGDLINPETLQRDGRVLLVPEAVFDSPQIQRWGENDITKITETADTIFSGFSSIAHRDHPSER